MSNVTEVVFTIHRAFQYVDDGRYEEWSELLSEDIRFCNMNHVWVEGRDAVLQHIKRRPVDGLTGRHLALNTVAGIRDDGSAYAVTDYLYVAQLLHGPFMRWEIVAVDRCADELTLEGGQWLFTKRVMTGGQLPGK